MIDPKDMTPTQVAQRERNVLFQFMIDRDRIPPQASWLEEVLTDPVYLEVGRAYVAAKADGEPTDLLSICDGLTTANGDTINYVQMLGAILGDGMIHPLTGEPMKLTVEHGDQDHERRLPSEDELVEVPKTYIPSDDCIEAVYLPMVDCGHLHHADWPWEVLLNRHIAESNDNGFRIVETHFLPWGEGMMAFIRYASDTD